MIKNIFSPGDILLPTNSELHKWSVVACDQYTSEPGYWQDVQTLVGDAPSSYHITFPEVYLEEGDGDKRIANINRTMEQYLSDGVFSAYKNTYIYVRRTLANKMVRHGLMGVVDLEEYNYNKGSQSPIRATEGTVLERIPPRVKVRINAPLELPHVMLLIDDRQKTVIEPLEEKVGSLTRLYDFTLMKDGGTIEGYAVDDQTAHKIDCALARLGDRSQFEHKYGVEDKEVLLFAVGDGNHSLATAKECYEQLKKQIGEEKAADHPARYALVELVNVHDEALEFEPIHRVVFGVNAQKLLAALEEYYQVSHTPTQGQEISYIHQNGEGKLWVTNPTSNLPVGTLQVFIDDYLGKNPGRVDYIHGDDVTRSLGKAQGNIGFILGGMEKTDLFTTVILDGVLPRKTFSMGHAWDKRYYLECRKIK